MRRRVVCGWSADDAHLAAHEPIDERRLADVGAAQHGDEAGAERAPLMAVGPGVRNGAAQQVARARRRRNRPRAEGALARLVGGRPATRRRRPARRPVEVAELGERLQADAAGQDRRRRIGRRRRASRSRRSPDVTAAARAARSAHRPTGYEAFSTFTPVKWRRPAVTSAAPTQQARVGRVGLRGGGSGLQPEPPLGGAGRSPDDRLVHVGLDP